MEEVTFLNHDIRLSGSLYLPDRNSPSPAVIVVHTASGGERIDPFYDHLKSELPKHGIALLVFDRRGCGNSEGVFETAGFEVLASDVHAAIAYLQSRPEIDRMRIGLHGTSQGGWIAPIAAAASPEIEFLIIVSASGVSPADQMNYGVGFHLAQAGFSQAEVEQAIHLRDAVNAYFRGQSSREVTANKLRRFDQQPWYEQAYLFGADRLPEDLTQSKWFYEMDYEPLSVWQRVVQPTLFVFAEVDEWVPIEQSMLNYRKATSHLQDVTLKQIAGTDHLLHTYTGAISQEYIELLLNWLRTKVGP